MIDMQKARDAAQYDDYKALQMFPAALDEIDQLREDNKNLQELFILRGELQAAHNKAVAEEHERELKAYADRIKELKEALIEERAMKLMTEHNTTSPIKDMVDFLGEARQQLEAGGKI